MREMEIMDLFTKTGAYREGHFRLSSGLHSAFYLQCALVLQDPVIAARLSEALAKKFTRDRPDVVIGPAMGGVIIAYEVARVMGAKAIFAERNDKGEMAIRRGFIVSPNDRVLVVEDVLTTGKSVKEVLALLKKKEITPVGIAALVDRSTEMIDFDGIKHESLIKLNVPVFTEADCPFCLEGIPMTKPGSRKEL
ncbi:MAG: orotate phosphoribosyltransferase [Candidatus Omnitrophica bacterium]|nr:orotate phosphoribosyltransferase [Candidatus Omnitrophota bacterium]